MSGRYIVICKNCEHVNYHQPVKGTIGRKPVIDPTLTKTEKNRIYRQNYLSKKQKQDDNLTEDELQAKKDRQQKHIDDYYQKQREQTPCLI